MSWSHAFEPWALRLTAHHPLAYMIDFEVTPLLGNGEVFAYRRRGRRSLRR